MALLDPVYRLPCYFPCAALARCRGYAEALRDISGKCRFHDFEPDFFDRRIRARRINADLPVERVHHVAARRESDRGRSMGVLQLAGVGDELPAAAAQLHPDPADPLRAS